MPVKCEDASSVGTPLGESDGVLLRVLNLRIVINMQTISNKPCEERHRLELFRLELLMRKPTNADVFWPSPILGIRVC
jgi:hypothetical protein